MKPTLNEEIEMSAKGVDYVNSLVPKTPTRNTNITQKDIDEWNSKTNKPNYLAIIAFFVGVCMMALWILCIYNLIKNVL